MMKLKTNLNVKVETTRTPAQAQIHIRELKQRLRDWEKKQDVIVQEITPAECLNRLDRLVEIRTKISEIKRQLCHAQVDYIAPIHNACRKVFNRCSGKWAGGDNSLDITIGTKAMASGETTRAWSSNGKWSGLDASYILSVPNDWFKTVLAAGIVIPTYRHVTLSAKKLDDNHYAAIVARNGRGCSVVLESGIIEKTIGEGGLAFWKLTHVKTMKAG